MTEPVQVPFWSKREGFIARECTRCGHRGAFEFFEDPVMVSPEVMCTCCGSITFTLVTEDPNLEDASIEEIVDAAENEPVVAETESGTVVVSD